MIKYLYLIVIFILSSCTNFGPLYGNNKDFEAFLSNIEIEEVETLQHSDLEHHIAKLFGSSSDTKYMLKVSVSDNITPLIITGRANVVKQNVVQLCDYSLIDKSTGVLLTKGTIRVVGSYTSDKTPYVSYTNEQYTKKNVTQTATEELRMRLMLYFKKNNI